jgi:monofunctional biosynthetic peptidoglycan transglycosylase
LPPVETLPERLAAWRTASPHAVWTPLWALSPRLQTAVVVWEDPGFYHHSGLSFEGIRRAALENWRRGGYARGGSTITQQVVKNLFLTREKTFRRKFDEAVLAWRLERSLSKEKILELYLNIVEWGSSESREGIFGAEAASRFYFGRSAAELTWAEAALLAGMLPNPRLFDPRRHPVEAYLNRRRVLTKLLGEGAITPDEFTLAEASPLLPAAGLLPSTPGTRDW